VVTYNRAELLHECLNALQAQSVPVSILVVNNASTDDTAEVLDRHRDHIDVVDLPENVGGAGGFTRGLKAAMESAAEYFWILDDDTIPDADCLEALLQADNDARELGSRPAFTASRVVWSDGRRHPMNQGMIDDRHDHAEVAASVRCVALKAASFVSVLVPRSAVETYGYPIEDFFIWGDDVEYTSRLSFDAPGLLVPSSVATHKTAYYETKVGARYYYRARNWLWIVRFSPAFRSERRKLLIRHLRGVVGTLASNRTREVWGAAARGLRDGLTKRPGTADIRWPHGSQGA
jgi:GT2 family glycosyltransferase